MSGPSLSRSIKLPLWIVCLSLLGSSWGISTGLAQSPASTPVKTLPPDRSGIIVNTSVKSSEPVSSPVKPERPTIADLPTTSSEVKAQLQRFEVSRESYLQRQKELSSQIKGAANEEQRQQARVQLQQLREQWLQQARSFRDQAQKNMADMRVQLRDHQSLLDSKSATTVTKERDRRIDK